MGACCSTAILLVAGAGVGLFVGSDLASAQAKRHGLQCGDTITRDTVLRRVLDCGEAGGAFGLSVQGPATLDLDGHGVRCSSDDNTGPGVCVILVGEGARLKGPGGVGARDVTGTAIAVAGDGGHRVSDVNWSSGETDGIQVISDNNTLEGNFGDGNPGFVITGNGNILEGNTDISRDVASFLVLGAENILTRNTVLGDFGIGVRGPSNRLINNVVRAQDPANSHQGIGLGKDAASTTVLGNVVVGASIGIPVASDRNLIVANDVRDSQQDGIRLAAGAESNVVLGNQARSNGGFDLFDGNPDCDANLWVANQFDDVNQACVALSLGQTP